MGGEITDHATLLTELQGHRESLADLLANIKAISALFADGNPVIQAVSVLREQMDDSQFGAVVQGAVEDPSEAAERAGLSMEAASDLLASLVPTIAGLAEMVDAAETRTVAAIGA